MKTQVDFQTCIYILWMVSLAKHYCISELPSVAFSAGLSHHGIIANGDKVIFDRIFIDLESAYNHVTGEFVAPVAGVYEFNYHALGQLSTAIWLELYHNYK